MHNINPQLNLEILKNSFYICTIASHVSRMYIPVVSLVFLFKERPQNSVQKKIEISTKQQKNPFYVQNPKKLTRGSKIFVLSVPHMLKFDWRVDPDVDSETSKGFYLTPIFRELTDLYKTFQIMSCTP